jgi:hypothetical protein
VAAGEPLPQPLQALDYRAVVLEAGPGEYLCGVHAIVPRLIMKGVPLLVVGGSGDIMEVMSYIRKALDKETIYVLDIT